MGKYAISFKGSVSRTKQCFKDEVNINNIVNKYIKYGKLPDMIQRDPQFGDFSDVPSYQESLNILQKANDQFMELPAIVRKKFGNDPLQMLDFVSDPANKEEMYDLGLAVRPIDPTIKGE